MSVRVDWLHLIEPSNVTGTWLNLVMSVRVDWLQNVPFLRKSVQTHNPMHYLASNKIDLDYRVCGRLFLDLFHNTLSGAWNAKKERKKMFELNVNSIMIMWADFAAIASQRWSIMTATFVMMHFLITLNGLRYFVEILFMLYHFVIQLFLVSGYVGVGDSWFFMKQHFLVSEVQF